MATKLDHRWDRKKEELGVLAERMKANLAEQRRPLVIEFSGTPKAGKSTCVNALAKFFRRHDIPVHVVVERASVCPLTNKSHPFFNVWTATTSLSQMLEGLERNAGVVILDRGIFDALVWMQLHLKRNALQTGEHAVIAEFLTLGLWRELINVVAALSVAPNVSLDREFKDQIVSRDGSIMNERTLHAYNDSLAACLQRYGESFNILHIDTSKREPLAGVTTIAEQVLVLADNLLDEEVAVIDREHVARFVPPSGALLDPQLVNAFLDVFRKNVKWMRRTQAEGTPTLVQPIPAAIFQHGQRSILTTHIRGPKHGRLADAHSVWIGGHLRRSDTDRSRSMSTTLRRCVSRELYEEIQVRVKPSELPETPSVIIWDDTQEHSIQHFALLFECRSGKHINDVYEFHNREYWESQGKSLFTQVLPVDEELAALPNWERWSTLYLEHKYGSVFPKDTRQRVLF